MTNKRPHLRAQTTGLLYALAQAGPGGATAESLGRTCGIRTRCAGARLRWLQRTHLVRYVKDTQVWQLADDSLFHRPAAPPHSELEDSP